MDSSDDEVPSLDEGLMTLVANLEPLYAAAEGQRRKLEERGWSAPAAEQAALEVLRGMIRLAFPSR
jgi:hypothetical protein